MVPSLPTEIVEHLLEYLSEDIQSLRVTSVLDRQWSDITRQYIFRTITFPLEDGTDPSIVPFFPPSTTKSLDNLLSCFIRHPYLIRCVHTVSIQNAMYDFGNPDKSLHKHLSLLLPKMENVRCLDLKSIRWSTMSVNLRQSIIHLVAHSPLTRLTAKSLTFETLDLIMLLSSAPRLEVLRLDGVWIYPLNSATVAPMPEANAVTLSHLRSLHIKTGNIAPVIPHVISPHTLTALTHLSLQTIMEDDHIIRNTLETPLASLRHLELSRLTSDMTMKLPTCLISLSISEHCDLPALCRILQQVDGPVALERISIVLGPLGPGTFRESYKYVPPVEVIRIDECLTRSHFHRLKATTFRFQEYMRGSVHEDQLFTSLRRSGVNVDVVYDVRTWYSNY